MKIQHDLRHGPEPVHPPIHRGLPPHHPNHRGILRLDFSEQDQRIFEEVFGNPDEAAAALDIISNAPPEIQILAVQVLKMIEEVA